MDKVSSSSLLAELSQSPSEISDSDVEIATTSPCETTRIPSSSEINYSTSHLYFSRSEITFSKSDLTVSEAQIVSNTEIIIPSSSSENNNACSLSGVTPSFESFSQSPSSASVPQPSMTTLTEGHFSPSSDDLLQTNMDAPPAPTTSTSDHTAIVNEVGSTFSPSEYDDILQILDGIPDLGIQSEADEPAENPFLLRQFDSLSDIDFSSSESGILQAKVSPVSVNSQKSVTGSSSSGSLTRREKKDEQMSKRQANIVDLKAQIAELQRSKSDLLLRSTEEIGKVSEIKVQPESASSQVEVDMTMSSNLTVADSGTECLQPMDDKSESHSVDELWKLSSHSDSPEVKVFLSSDSALVAPDSEVTGQGLLYDRIVASSSRVESTKEIPATVTSDVEVQPVVKVKSISTKSDLVVQDLKVKSQLGLQEDSSGVFTRITDSTDVLKPTSSSKLLAQATTKLSTQTNSAEVLKHTSLMEGLDQTASAEIFNSAMDFQKTSSMEVPVQTKSDEVLNPTNSTVIPSQTASVMNLERTRSIDILAQTDSVKALNAEYESNPVMSLVNPIQDFGTDSGNAGNLVEEEASDEDESSDEDEIQHSLDALSDKYEYSMPEHMTAAMISNAKKCWGLSNMVFHPFRRGKDGEVTLIEVMLPYAIEREEENSGYKYFTRLILTSKTHLYVAFKIRASDTTRWVIHRNQRGIIAPGTSIEVFAYTDTSSYEINYPDLVRDSFLLTSAPFFYNVCPDVEVNLERDLRIFWKKYPSELFPIVEQVRLAPNIPAKLDWIDEEPRLIGSIRRYRENIPWWIPLKRHPKPGPDYGVAETILAESPVDVFEHDRQRSRLMYSDYKYLDNHRLIWRLIKFCTVTVFMVALTFILYGVPSQDDKALPWNWFSKEPVMNPTWTEYFLSFANTQ